MKGLNLAGFKKLKSDAKTTTLKHPSGHKIIINHSALKPEHAKQLHALAFDDGGKVPGGNGSPAIDPSKVGGDVTESGDPIVKAVSSFFGGDSKAKGGYVDTTDSDDPIVKAIKRTPAPDTRSGTPNSKPTPENTNDTKYKSQVADFNAKMAPEDSYAQGGGVRMYADGTPDAPVQDTPDQIVADAAAQAPQTQPSDQDFAAAHPILDRLGLNGKLFGGPGMQSNVSSDDLYAVPASGGMGMSPAQAVSPGPNGSEPIIPGTTNSPDQQSTPDQGPSNPPQQAQQSPSGSNIPAGMQAGLNLQMKGLQSQYNAEKQAGEGKAQAAQQALQDQAAQSDSYDSRMAKMQDERQDILNDKIDPHHFWNSKDTVGKIGTILGLLVGGLGGNDGSKFLNTAIERDIDAQKTNKSNALNAITQMIGDTNTGAQYHRVVLNDQVAHAMDLAMAKAATPQALANLQQAKGKLMFDSGIRMAQIGAQQTLNSPAPNPNDVDKSLNTLRMLDPTKAKEVEARIIPGVGVASIPVETKTRDAFVAGQTFMQQMDNLEKFRQAHGGGGSLFGAAADEGHRLAELARNSFRIAQGEGVFKSGLSTF